MIMFGITEILFSQIPDFDQIWWLSIVAAVMSFTYSSIGLALGVAKVVGMNDEYKRKLYIFGTYMLLTNVKTIILDAINI